MNDDREDKRGFYRRLSECSSIVFILPAALLIGLFVGDLLERWLGTFPWLTTLFLLLGLVAGVMEMFRILGRR